MSVNRAAEDRRFAAEVMLVYRLSHGDRYFTHEYLEEKQEYAGEIYRIIDSHESSISTPGMISRWPAKRDKYEHKL